MNIEQKENQAAERVIHSAYGQAISYAKPEDLQAATVALLWASFVKEAKIFGLQNWKGLRLE
jgi:hypothetical protein